jgi:hypothetical protein
VGQRVRYQPGPGPEVPLLQDHHPRQNVSPVGVARLRTRDREGFMTSKKIKEPPLFVLLDYLYWLIC